jgi:exopolysaccharide production protein ExoQ
MANSSLETIAKKLETPLVGLILLYYFGVHLSPFATPVLTLVMNWGSYCVLILLIIWRWKRFLYVINKDVFPMIFIGLAIASILWSAAPEMTSNEVRALVRSTCLGAYIAARYSFRDQMSLVAFSAGVGGLLSLLSSLSSGLAFDPSIPWQGIFAYKNFLACVMLTGSLLLSLIITDFPNQRSIAVAFLFVTFPLLILSQAKTAYLDFFIVACLPIIRKIMRQHYKIRAALFILCLLLFGSIAVFLGGNLEYIFVQILGKNLEFNGRLPIWQLMFDKIFERPFLGYGVAGFWTSDHALHVLDNSWASIAREQGIRFYAHNGYIDLLLSLGFVGLFVFLLNMALTFIRVIKLFMLTKSVENFWMIQFLCAILLYNFSETAGVVTESTYWSVVVSIILSSAVQVDEIRKKNYWLRVQTLG